MNNPTCTTFETAITEIVRRLPDLVKDGPENAETVIRSLIEGANPAARREPKCPEWMLPPKGEWRAITSDGEIITPPVETLRDRFAMAALTGLISSGNIGNGNVNINGKYVGYDVAAYLMADAMLKERQK